MDKKAMVQALISHFTNGNKAQFAKILGVSPQTISAWVARNTFDSELIYTKCRYLSAHWLLTGEGEMLKTSTPKPPEETPQAEKSEKIASVEDITAFLAYMREKDKIISDKDATIEQKNQEIRTLDRKVAQLEGENHHLMGENQHLTAENHRLQQHITSLDTELQQYRTASAAPAATPAPAPSVPTSSTPGSITTSPDSLADVPLSNVG